MLNIDDFLVLMIRLSIAGEDLRDGILAMCDEMTNKPQYTSGVWHPQRVINALNELLNRQRMTADAVRESMEYKAAEWRRVS